MKHPGKTSLTEFRAACIVICILILSTTVPRLYDRFFGHTTSALPTVTAVVSAEETEDPANASFEKQTKQNIPRSGLSSKSPVKSYSDFRKPIEVRTPAIACKPFDPNTVTAEELAAMGVRNYIPENIEKYRAAGGTFRRAEDLGKIYGVDSVILQTLISCIRIDNPDPKRSSRSSGDPVDINTAGFEEWKALPGIGDVLADRIIRFRDRLGGFHSVGQVADTYGLLPETFDRLAERLTLTEGPRLIDLNLASIDELRSHPYITFRQAQGIVNYRQHHGKFSEVADVMQVLSLSEEWLARMAPYLTCDKATGTADLAVK